MFTGAIRERSKGQGRMEGAWQQVTAYIVQLEKRLREMELHTSQGSADLVQSILALGVSLQVQLKAMRHVPVPHKRNVQGVGQCLPPAVGLHTMRRLKEK